MVAKGVIELLGQVKGRLAADHCLIGIPEVPKG